jgi:hypothetical protein
MNSAAITYTNKVSTVRFAYDADATTCTVETNGKVETLSGDKAIEFEQALSEAGYHAH